MTGLPVDQMLESALEHHRAGRLAEAESIYRSLLSLNPKPDAAVYNNFAILLQQQGKLQEAIATYRKAITASGGIAEIHNNLATLLLETGQIDQAIASARQAIALRPDYADAFYNLGNGLRAEGELDHALEAYQRAAVLSPANPNFLVNVGGVLKDLGRLDEAIEQFRRAAALQNEPWAASNLLHTLHYHPGYTPDRIFREHENWGAALAKRITPIEVVRFRKNSSDRLRIGYVSPDFRDHVVGWNILPLFRHHDRSQFEIFCYSNLARAPDAVTQQFQTLSDGWRDISKLSDEQSARLIRDDQIDILVDLAVHTAHNRLGVFAYKPAPLHVSFAGYPATTGLTRIDYRLTDRWLDPAGQTEQFSSERLWRLPESFWCYEPQLLDVAPNTLPAISRGFVTFAFLGNFCKVNEEVLKLRAQVLSAVPNSRLVLLAPPGSARERVRRLLTQSGIETRRVQFVDRRPQRDYLQTYHQIDIALDSFPYGGHTTNLDSLWMGVPVVTLVGQTAVSRAGWSQLNNLGLSELAAFDPQQFVSIAYDLAANLPRLSGIRESLRKRMEQSPLMDAPRFARNIESAFQSMLETDNSQLVTRNS